MSESNEKVLGVEFIDMLKAINYTHKLLDGITTKYVLVEIEPGKYEQRLSKKHEWECIKTLTADEMISLLKRIGRNSFSKESLDRVVKALDLYSLHDVQTMYIKRIIF